MVVIGDEFNYWKVKSLPWVEKYRKYVICKCKCGTEKRVDYSHLISGRSKNCGCVRKLNFHFRKHGCSKTKLYRIWKGMRERCQYKEHIGYKNYGERGIIVCEEWDNSYEVFAKWMMDNGYKDGLQIDRINTNGNYEPTNCKISTVIENCNNKNNNIRVEIFGEIKTISQWGRDKRCVVNRRTLQQRIRQYGWDAEKALLTPSESSENQNCTSYLITAWGETKSTADWARDSRAAVKATMIIRRIFKFHWKPEHAISVKLTRGQRPPEYIVKEKVITEKVLAA